MSVKFEDLEETWVVEPHDIAGLSMFKVTRKPSDGTQFYAASRREANYLCKVLRIFEHVANIFR